MKRYFFSLAALALVSGCATTLEQADPTQTSQALPHDITAGQARLVARLYPELAEKAEPNDNLFISPLSLSEGLGLALLGARGQTEAEMRDLLGWDAASKPELMIKSYDRLLTQTGDEKVALSIANALWLSDEIAFVPEYLLEAKDGFGATTRQVDFGGDPEGSAETINGWVSEQTRQRITRIVEANGFDDRTAAVLTNAVWFKADWSVPFEDGSAGEFTRGDGTTRSVYMMERIAPMPYRETREGQAVQLSYGANGRFVMEVFLPKDMRILKRWERNLRSGSFDLSMEGSDAQFELGGTEERPILLRLPRFEARFDKSVKSALIAAGMPCAFSANCADFGDMAAAPVAIDDVAHATFLRVDEKGTEAAAVTAVKIVVVGARRLREDLPKMIVDRPFLLTIRDRESGALIFFGRVADPISAEQAQ